MDSHACALEANMRVPNGIPLGCPLLLPVGTVNRVQTLKAASWAVHLIGYVMVIALVGGTAGSVLIFVYHSLQWLLWIVTKMLQLFKLLWNWIMQCFGVSGKQFDEPEDPDARCLLVVRFCFGGARGCNWFPRLPSAHSAMGAIFHG